MSQNKITILDVEKSRRTRQRYLELQKESQILATDATLNIIDLTEKSGEHASQSGAETLAEIVSLTLSDLDRTFGDEATQMSIDKVQKVLDEFK